MVRLRSGHCTSGLLEGTGTCCLSRLQAASRAHYNCFRSLPLLELECFEQPHLFARLSRQLRRGIVNFARRLFLDREKLASDFAYFCGEKNDAVSLRLLLGMGATLNVEPWFLYVGSATSADCLRVLLEYGVPWVPHMLLYASRDNRLDILEIVLKHSREWAPRVPGVAAACGNVRFLMRAFEAGCPVWASAQDGEPKISYGGIILPRLVLPGVDGGEDQFFRLEDWSLVVSSDLVCSGPVLLYAAQKGAPLTLRMQGMLGDVRRRALALACCFHRAAHLSRAPRAAARKWKSMGRVPLEIVQNIATLARISIVAVDLIE